MQMDESRPSVITDRFEEHSRVVEGQLNRITDGRKTIEPLILTMDVGGRFSVWSLVNGAQHSPSRVKSGPGAACYASRWDVAPGGPDRARSCHWPPLTPPRTTHCSTCPPCRLVPRVTSYTRVHPTWKPSIFREDPPCYRAAVVAHHDPKIRGSQASITICNSDDLYFLRFFLQSFQKISFLVTRERFWVIKSLIELNQVVVKKKERSVIDIDSWNRIGDNTRTLSNTQNSSSLSSHSLLNVTIVIKYNKRYQVSS